jgi:hypothetical protein
MREVAGWLLEVAYGMVLGYYWFQPRDWFKDESSR